MRRAVTLVFGCLTALLVQSAAPAVATQASTAARLLPEHSSQPSLSARVRGLLAALTLDEKLALNQQGVDPDRGDAVGYTRGVPRLGIPPLRWVDGPGGVETRQDATALPQPLALAATFNRELSRRYGEVQGQDTRALHMDVFLGPMVNIARLPNWGRNATSLGEDPFLTSELTGPQVEGIQSQGAIASVKHFVGYNQAFGVDSDQHQKLGNDFIVDSRTLHEIYLPGFEAAVHARVGTVMAAYNVINGQPNASNPDTLIGILRDELHFDGAVESDWGANHSTDSIARGLDVEFFGTGAGQPRATYWGPALKADIEAGRIPMAALDGAVGRVLSLMERFGLLDDSRVPAPSAVDIDRGAAVALQVAEQSAVLLKNDGALPLRKSLRTIAMIGPTAGQLAANPGTGSSAGIAARKVAPVDALRRVVGPDTQVVFATGQTLTGEPIPASALVPETGQGAGLTRHADDGTPLRVDPGIDFTGDRALPPLRAYRWKGTLKVAETGDYVLMTQSWGGGALLRVDGQIRGRSAIPAFGGAPKKNSSLLPSVDGLDNGRVMLHLEAGSSHAIELEAHAWPDQTMSVRLNWVTPELRRKTFAAAVEAAKGADAAIVFAWQRAGEQSNPEGDLLLPERQNDLIAAVAAANPDTTVVLTSGAVQMPWLKDVRAVLEVWFPGQEGGTALANLLTGRANPSGKLPLTFPARMEDTPAAAPGHPERYRGVDGKVIYSEGVLVGYRWYDENRLAPLYAFGHGLSYTAFRYSAMTARAVGDGIDVQFTVANVGAQKGAEVPQVYLGRPARAPMPMAPRQLVGFDRVELMPGESRVVRIHVPRRQLSYWSDAAHGWRVAAGTRTISVGASSRDIRLKRTVPVAAHDD